MTRGWNPIEVVNPRGMWSSLIGKRKGNPARASAAQNIRISPGIAACRPGTSIVSLVKGGVTEMFNWISPLGENLVLYYDGADVRIIRQSDSTDRALELALTMSAPSFSDLANRVYFCGYDTAGAGTIQAHVWDGTYTGGLFPDADICFRKPLVLDDASVATDGGAGLCTIGTHLLGVVYQSRSGFAGYPTIATADATALTVTLGSDNRTISLAISIPPSELIDTGPTAALYAIMTRADNPAKWYFVTGAETVVDPTVLTVNFTHTFSISISDEVLATSNSADENFNLVTQASDGTGPFNPTWVNAYGKRMVYGAGDKAYASSIDDAQHITEDLHVVTMPNRRRIGFGFPLPGSADFYLTGDKWTGRITENGDDPDTWAQPISISESLGGPFPGCVCNRTAGPYAWVAAEPGLYLFDGAFPNHPITYLCADQWQRINWNAAYAVRVRDDTVNLKCYVAVPFDSATVCDHLFVIDYTNGIRFDTCDITIDSFKNSPSGIRSFSSIETVKEYASGRSNLWIGPSNYGAIVHFDDSTHNDVAWT
jgi:hypothetical protein